MIAAVVIVVAVGLALAAYLYGFAGRHTCPRCGKRHTYAHTGYVAPVYVCRDCGAVFDDNGLLP